MLQHPVGRRRARQLRAAEVVQRAARDQVDERQRQRVQVRGQVEQVAGRVELVRAAGEQRRNQRDGQVEVDVEQQTHGVGGEDDPRALGHHRDDHQDHARQEQHDA